jgi:hypothetical protein
VAEALDDAWAKVDRAGEHIEALKAEIRRFSNGRPYRVTGDPDLNSGEYVLRIKPEEPPKRISVLIGDVLGNLRPSLDYLVGALAVFNGEKIQQSHQFPICDTPALFKGELDKGRLAGIAPDHVALIEKLQPYKRRKGKVWIRLLREYSNPDKHRHLNVLLTHIEGDFALPSPARSPTTTARHAEITSVAPGGSVTAALESIRKMSESGRFFTSPSILEAREAARKHLLTSMPSSVAFNSAGQLVPSVAPDLTKASSALARAAAGISNPVTQAAKPTSNRNVHVELSVSVGVAFPDGTPVVETMEILESQVAKTLNAFETFFE